MSFNIYQWAATVPRIDRCVGLYEDSRVILAQLACTGADHSQTDGILHSERTADRQYQLALLHIERVGEFHWLEIRRGDFQQREVEQPVASDDFRFPQRIPPAGMVVQLYTNRAGSLNDMRIRDDVTVVGQNDAGSRASFFCENTETAAILLLTISGHIAGSNDLDDRR